jgi:hypothetical protein
MTNRTAAIRTFNSSVEARAAGFSTIEWLRAFTFNEHCAFIDAERKVRDMVQTAIFPAWVED